MPLKNIMENNGSKKNFSQILIEKGIITSQQLRQALDYQKEKSCSLNEAVFRLGYIDETQLLILLSKFLSIPPIKVKDLNIPGEIIKLIPQDLVLKYSAVPISKIGNTLTVAVFDPLNLEALDDLEKITGCQINPVIGLYSDIHYVIEKRDKESITATVEEIIKGASLASIEIINEEKKEVAETEILRSIEEAPVIKFTNYILKRAVEEKSSDILIEPLQYNARVRLRVDGLLREIETFPRKMLDFITSRIKVISNLNITEHRLPQDGRFRMSISDRDVIFRVSVLPTILGEKTVLRVLDKTQGLLDLNGLGYEPDVAEQIKKDSLSSYGMILLCGPTGSGKTTTLYSILKYIYTPEKNIITVEDPLEYQLEGINQVNVNYDVGLTFTSALRSILRQDPDVIMIGEIRDFDTVDIAIKAALTGHLVLSTLHTTTACGSITRLINMGVEPFLISSTVISVLAQRLMRQLCPKCKEIYKIGDDIREKYNISKNAVLYKPKGCKLCAGEGYKRRVSVTEYLHLDQELKKLINSAADEHTIKKEAKKQGMRSLREDGILKLEKGITSIEEVLHVTMSEKD